MPDPTTQPSRGDAKPPAPVVAVIVHGAYHPPACYEPLAARLRDSGRFGPQDVLALRLPSLGAGKFAVTLADDVQALRAFLADEVVAKGRDAVLVAHSYGGAVTTLAVKALLEGERAEGAGGGRAGWVRGIVYMAATLAAEGETVAEVCSPHQDHHLAEVKDGLVNARCDPSKARAEYYAQCPPAAAERCMALLEPHCAQVFMTPLPASCRGDMLQGGEGQKTAVERTYIVCRNDAQVEPAMQERMVAESPGMRAVRTDSDHSPFLCRPEVVVAEGVRMAALGGKGGGKERGLM